MSDLAEVLEELPVEFRRAFRVVEQVAERVTKYEKLLDALEARLLLVDELPDEAPFGALIRLRVGTVGQRATLYLGNGPGQPLSKLVPVAV